MKIKNSTELLRHLLASIDLSDIKEELSDEEFQNRATDAELFYKNHFEKVIKILIQKQLEFMGQYAEDLEQFLVGRGTINGLSLIKEWFEDQVQISLSRFEEKKPELKEPFEKV